MAPASRARVLARVGSPRRPPVARDRSNSRSNRGHEPEESRELLDELLTWTTQERFVYSHEWSVGDLVVWDNTGMLHRALPYDPSSERLMRRTTIVGDEAWA